VKPGTSEETCRFFSCKISYHRKSANAQRRNCPRAVRS
jgi:hypothetical protein